MSKLNKGFKIFVIAALVVLWVGIICGTAFLWSVSDVFRLLGGGVLLYVFIFIYVVALALPFVFSKWLSEYFSLTAKSVVSSLLAIVITALIFVGAVSYISEFTPKKWAAYEPLRIYMIDDFEDEYTVLGKTNEEIVELLGEPKSVLGNDELYEYYVGDGIIDPYGYQIEFENGRVINKKLIEH